MIRLLFLSRHARLPAAKAIDSVQEVVETHLVARVPRGEAAEALPADTWHKQVTVAAWVPAVETLVRLLNQQLQI